MVSHLEGSNSQPLKVIILGLERNLGREVLTSLFNMVGQKDAISKIFFFISVMQTFHDCILGMSPQIEDLNKTQKSVYKNM